MGNEAHTMKFLRYFKTGNSLSMLFSVLSIVLGLLGAALVIRLLGIQNPLLVYREMFLGSFGTEYGFLAAVTRFMPLAFGGLAVTLAFRGGVFNVGVEGQLYMGALFATIVGVSFQGLPRVIHLPMALLAGAVAGAVWGFIPGYLKATRGFNEILITIFMNYIGIYLVGASLSTFLKEPGQGIAWSAKIPKSAMIPRIPGLNISAGILLIIIIAILLWYILSKRTLGYEIKAVGCSKEAAEYGGVNSSRVMMITMVISGAIASFAGSVEILGIQYRLQSAFLVGFGYNAIPVALLGGLNPIGTLIAAFFYGVLLNGASAMQISLGVPVSLVNVIMALAILSSIGMNGIRNLLKKW